MSKRKPRHRDTTVVVRTPHGRHEMTMSVYRRLLHIHPEWRKYDVEATS